MKVQEIRELIKLVDNSNLSELTFESEGTKIKLKKPEGGAVVYSTPEVNAVEVKPAAPTTATPAAKPVEAPKAAEQAPVAAVEVTSDLHKITSPMVGTFYASPSPDAACICKSWRQSNWRFNRMYR